MKNLKADLKAVFAMAFIGWPFLCYGIALTVSIASGGARASQDKGVMVLRADRAIPATVVVKKDFPDTGLVCMEPPTGTFVCRPAGMFRKWMLDSTQERIKK